MATEDEYLALLLSTQAEKATGSVLDQIRTSGIAKKCYAYKIRAKDPDGLLRKKQIKLPKKPNYKITSITDILGLRLVTLFKSDMLTVVQSLFESLASGGASSPFQAGQPEEVIVYVGTSALDDFYTQVKAIVTEVFPEAKIDRKNSTEGYSSIHIVTRLKDEVKHPALAEVAPFFLPIEIQIRTVFEDAWGEIDHKYGYVIREGKKAGSATTNPEHVLAHLKVLKQFSDACMDYAESIRNEAESTERVDVTESTRTISVESDDELIARFYELNLGEDFIGRYKEARVLREAAQRSGSGTFDERQSDVDRYLQAAEAFRELGNEIDSSDKFERLDEPQCLALYYCRMNQALCLMSTNRAEQVQLALGIYQRLEGHFADWPLLKMRLGQAYGKTKKLDLAITKIAESGKLLQDLGKTALSAGRWTDQLPKADFEHMQPTQPKLLGYYLWKKAESLGKDHYQEKADLFFQAYNCTLLCLDVSGMDAHLVTGIVNNIVYYCIGYLFNCNKAASKPAQYGAIQTGLSNYLDKLMSSLGPEENWQIEELDTIFKAKALLGEKDAAPLADRLRTKCLNANDTMEMSVRMSLAATANSYLQTGILDSMEL